MELVSNKSQYGENDVRLCYLEGQPEECVRYVFYDIVGESYGLTTVLNRQLRIWARYVYICVVRSLVYVRARARVCVCVG